MATIAVLGTLDTKGHEHAYVADQIRQLGHNALLIDVGTGGAAQVAADIDRFAVAAAAGIDLPALIAAADRGVCVSAMSEAAPRFLLQLHDDRRIDAVISLGGGGGTAIGTAAMRALPIGFPKLMVSTLASGNTSHYVDTKDITMMPSVVDIAGLNRVTKVILTRAAGAICGMASVDVADSKNEKPLIVASMFGNTTQCVEAAKTILESKGFEVLVFHSTGAGGRAMEALIESGMVAGVLDLTTTELADEVVGGVLSAGPSRLDAAGIARVPTVVAPGCLDMVNFGQLETIPVKFADRKFYVHNPQVTLMRTTPDECVAIGRMIAQKLNRYHSPITLMLPQRAISIISAPGQPFHDAQADAALFDAMTSTLRSDIEVHRLDCEINDPAFAAACTDQLLKNIHA